MVRKGYCGAAVLGGAPAKAVDATRSVQERVLTVDVEMNKLTHRTALDPLLLRA